MSTSLLHLDLRPKSERTDYVFIPESASVETIEEALAAFRQKKPRILVAHQPSLDLFAAHRASRSDGIRILVTDMPMAIYSQALQGHEGELLDHVVNAGLSPEHVSQEVKVVLDKIFKGCFGLAPYLKASTPVLTCRVEGLEDREKIYQKLEAFAAEQHLNSTMTRSAWAVAEELLLNAFIDAPMAAGRRATNRTNPNLPLPAPEPATFSIGFDGSSLVLGVTDQFGSFTRDAFFSYIRKILARSSPDSLLDLKISGAGIGLFKILFRSHALIVNVIPGQKTEVIACLRQKPPLRDVAKMARSIHFFEMPKMTPTQGD